MKGRTFAVTVPMLLAGAPRRLPSVDEPVDVRADGAGAHDRAVVVGFESYYQLPAVPHAGNDARAFRDWLVQTRRLPPSAVQYLDEHTDAESLRQAIREQALAVEPGGRLWVYYAGHGIADPVTGERLLVAPNAVPKVASIRGDSVSLDELDELVGGTDTIALVDACYTGETFGSEFAGARPVKLVHTAEAGEGRLTIWTATAEAEQARPIESVGHGAFTYLAIGALRGWADGAASAGEADGVVTLGEAQTYVEHALRDVEILDQHPTIAAGIAGSDDLVLIAGSSLDPRPDLVGVKVGLAPAAVASSPAPRPPPPTHARRASPLGVGVELGLPTGVRAELRFDDSAISEAGLRLGANLGLLSSSAGGVFGAAAFVDLRLADRWDLELSGGGGSVVTSMYVLGGGWASVAAQYDPPSPLFLNVGVGVGHASSVLVYPELGAGFVW